MECTIGAEMMTEQVHWAPRIYAHVSQMVAQEIAKMGCPEHLLRDDVVAAILQKKSSWPTTNGLKGRVTVAILKQGYVRKMPRNTRKVEFIRQDVKQDPCCGHELRTQTLKAQHPDLAPAIAEILQAAKYPIWITANKVLAELDEMGISARTKSMKGIITYIMPELGYGLKRNPDGRLQQQNKVRRTYYKMEVK